MADASTWKVRLTFRGFVDGGFFFFRASVGEVKSIKDDALHFTRLTIHALHDRKFAFGTGKYIRHISQSRLYRSQLFQSRFSHIIITTTMFGIRQAILYVLVVIGLKIWEFKLSI